jgi:hypothetical protein
VVVAPDDAPLAVALEAPAQRGERALDQERFLAVHEVEAPSLAALELRQLAPADPVAAALAALQKPSMVAE